MYEHNPAALVRSVGGRAWVGAGTCAGHQLLAAGGAAARREHACPAVCPVAGYAGWAALAGGSIPGEKFLRLAAPLRRRQGWLSRGQQERGAKGAAASGWPERAGRPGACWPLAASLPPTNPIGVPARLQAAECRVHRAAPGRPGAQAGVGGRPARSRDSHQVRPGCRRGLQGPGLPHLRLVQRPRLPALPAVSTSRP